MQPAVGGSSPPVNPQVALATAFGARNTVPSFISVSGPVREARFRRTSSGAKDGGVHALFTISGRVDATGNASGCSVPQEDFPAQIARNNVTFRIPTPVFGTGLIESIPDSALRDNLGADSDRKSRLGIRGKFNRKGNDGTITRFGWKAQNISMLVFSGEAYNVEMGITNEAFTAEREETASASSRTAQRHDVPGGRDGRRQLSSIEKFAFFMRFLDAPKPSATAPGGADSIGRGKQRSPAVAARLATRRSSRPATRVRGLKNQPVNLYSDLAVHQDGAAARGRHRAGRSARG